MDLKQEGHTIEKYEEEFTALSLFVEEEETLKKREWRILCQGQLGTLGNIYWGIRLLPPILRW